MRPFSVAILALLTACGGGPEETKSSAPSVRIAGSETVTRGLVPALIETHQRTRRPMEFTVDGGGSGGGFKRLLAGEIDIAAASRNPLPAEEEQARVNGYSLMREGSRHIVAVDVVALATHKSRGIDSLTYDQVIGIFCTRSVDNWSFLGLEDAPIRAITRDPKSGTRALFEDFFCGPRGIHPRVEVVGQGGKVGEIIENDPNAIGYITLSEQSGKVIGLRPHPEGQRVMPSQQTIIRGAYPLYHDLYLFTAGPPRRATAEFINWISSPAGQEVVDENRFVPLFLRPQALDSPRPLRETIHFDADEQHPNQRSAARLQLLIKELKERGHPHVILEGYTDSTEKDAFALAERRAEAVKALLDGDLPDTYFEIIPRGAMNPIAPNSTPYGRQRNRRVQIYLQSEENLPPDAAEIVDEGGEGKAKGKSKGKGKGKVSEG